MLSYKDSNRKSAMYCSQEFSFYHLTSCFCIYLESVWLLSKDIPKSGLLVTAALFLLGALISWEEVKSAQLLSSAMWHLPHPSGRQETEAPEGQRHSQENTLGKKCLQRGSLSPPRSSENPGQAQMEEMGSGVAKGWERLASASVSLPWQVSRSCCPVGITTTSSLNGFIFRQGPGLLAS